MTPPPVVAINTLSVTPANEGTRTMLQELLPALQRVAPELELLLIGSRANRDMFAVDARRFEVRVSDGQTLRRIAYDQLRVPRLAKNKADLLVTPAGVGPLRIQVPHVVIVAAHMVLPSCQRVVGTADFHAWHRAYYGAPFRRSLRSAHRVLGISQFLADGLVRELGVDVSKVRAMPLGARLPATVGSHAQRELIVLFVGTLYEHKQAAMAIRSFAKARSSLEGARLVIAGRDPGGRIAELRALAVETGASDSVDLLGPVSAEHLEDLYGRASLLMLPSRCEGFGLPIVEAMGRGVPVLAAETTALPEVVGDAGLLVDPDDVDGFSAAIVAVLGDPARRRDLAARGRHRAETFTWEAAAEHLARAIRESLP